MNWIFNQIMPSADLPRLLYVILLHIGHACIWTYLLNNLYGRKIPKKILKPWRIVTGLVILFGLLAGAMMNAWITFYDPEKSNRFLQTVNALSNFYCWLCLVVSCVVFPLFTLKYHFGRSRPRHKIIKSEIIDVKKLLGKDEVYGQGKWWFLARLPLTSVFKVEFTEIELPIKNLPKEWDGLSILHLSDLHFHGTPTYLFFEFVINEIQKRWPTHDLITLTGDYLDSDQHLEWIPRLLGKLPAKEGKFALLGNHDEHHQPTTIRQALEQSGYTIVSNCWQSALIRNRRLAVVGNEQPWFQQAPQTCPAELQEHHKLALTHSPDQVFWAKKLDCFLTLAGHVHGGQIRLPVIGSIFVPSIYSRRFDCGLFDVEGMPLNVSRGLSGKEPLRYLCNPNVIRIILKCE